MDALINGFQSTRCRFAVSGVEMMAELTLRGREPSSDEAVMPSAAEVAAVFLLPGPANGLLRAP
jgi:hypothetical protein